ncbi:FAD/NAD(P)-binding protein [Sphingomonas corticis]|jgi:uncharacterized NAD(P)/FAD-binding protein YdhS|uniref:FAD-dependent oxidoreductase n=1 Tax=Sphingomonas corticis TaxID=2722791 RepID=A0ABX1CVA8_9SPHN|nr:FAD/NAD(P)-binding protein [Sphingomonas corticis]NJR79910.1 FAD-dependent oxidoreductase [Sphingomonas corticis]
MIDHVAIVGAGFSGTLLAINLLRLDGPRATLIERAPVAGQGVAYGTPHDEHVLNVRAANMSALPDDPGHFVRWLAERGEADAGGAFVPRKVYGAYLRDMLDRARADAPDRLAVIHGEAVDLRLDAGARLTLADGGTIAADVAVLAVGNLPPHLPAPLAAVAGLPRYRADPWDGAIVAEPGADDVVVLVGTGLTMVDVALRLDGAGFRGRMLALSRRGLTPHRHAAGAPAAPPLAERPRGEASALVREVRRRGAAIGWRAAVDELRPYTQAMWASAEPAQRARFLRHLRPWWDVHRHRLAPIVADRLAALAASGRLRVVAAKLADAHARPDGIDLAYRPRGAEAVQRVTAQAIVNCTGPLGDLSRTREPLLAGLVARGTIRPDAEHLGIDVDAQARTIARDGAADNRLCAIGPMTRGAFWEIVAVPDIRRQAWDLARRLSNAHWVEGEGL